MCAAFLGAELALPPDHIEDHAAYIADWLQVLKDNPGAFLTAAGKAQLAADYLLRLMGETHALRPPCA
jgi:antirestriction protein ArdC